MLFKLSLKNIKKSIKDYSIYFFTLVVAVAIFYIFNSMDAQKSMLALTSYKHEMIDVLIMILGYVSIFVSIILGFLIVYSNNFLIKRRKKEIGLYLTLGMSKRKVSMILVIETLLVGTVSLIVGLSLGIFLSQFLSIITAKLFETNLEEFKFVFSSYALIKTLVYFGIIFILVMLFNVISLSRYKLIDLLNASKKSEQVKVRNKYVTIISFIISLGLIIYAYKLLFDGSLFMMGDNTIIMIICGALATLLFFFSLSGFLLTIFEKIKKVYYKDLNMFVLKQINSKVNTSVISTTVICLMLLLTIGILSGSMSLANAFNKDLKENNKTDFTLYNNFARYYETGIISEKYDFNRIINNNELNNYVKEYVEYNKYYIDNINIDSLLTDKARKEVYKTFNGMVQLNSRVLLMKESDYNKLMKFFNEKVIDIKDDQYLVLANISEIVNFYNYGVKENNKIVINNISLSPINKIEEIGLENYNGTGNDGVIVVSDHLLDGVMPDQTIIVGNYINSDKDLLEKDFSKFLSENEYPDFLMRTKLQMESSSISIKVMVTFIGMYLGIIFAISSATVLAIGQLSESSDNKERFKVLRQIGADEKMINRALFTQIAISFLLPFVVALFHAFFGLREVNKMIKILGNLDLTTNILITALFIVVVYGGYFMTTYLASKNIIKE